MEIYTPKPKIKLSPVVRNGREFVEVTFGNDNDIRLSLSKEENVLLVGGRAYLPAENFVLAEFFDRYVKMAFIDYSAIKETAPRKEEDKRPPLPEGYLEKLQQVRYSDHTVRVYTSYFRDFQQYFEGRKIETVTPDEINDYLLYLIHEKNISSCQQNQRINAIKFYYEKVLGQERRCYTGEDAARRVEQGGNKENTRRDSDRPAFLLYVLHTLLRRVAHQRTAGTETRRHQRTPLPDTGASGKGQEGPLHPAVKTVDEKADGI